MVFEGQPSGIESKYSEELSFLLSPISIYFIDTLPPVQAEVVSYFTSNYQEGLTISDILRNGMSANQKLEDLLGYFYIVLEKIVQYFEFLEIKGETTEVFNEETAPYFWLEQQRALMPQTTYEVSDENDPQILEFVNFKKGINSRLIKNLELNELEIRIAKLLLSGDTYPIIASKLGLDLQNVSKVISITERKIGKAQSTNEMIIEYLKLEPRLKKVLFLALKGIANADIADMLETTAVSIDSAVYQLRQMYGDNIINLRRSNAFDIEYINKKVIPANRQFQVRNFLIEVLDLETIVNEYLSNPDSQYKDGIKKLYEENEFGYLKLYFLLCEVPDRVLLASLIGFSEKTIKDRITELKKAILPANHPAIELKDYENWVEITPNGFKFLLTEQDLAIVAEIRNQFYASRLSGHSIAEAMEISPSTVKNRVTKMNTWLKVKDLKSIVETLDNKLEI